MIDHLDDLEADFLVFYGIEDIESMGSRRFFRLAPRVSAYQGVMAARVASEYEQQQQTTGNTPTPTTNRSKAQSVAAMREAGAEVTAVDMPERSYLHERLAMAGRR